MEAGEGALERGACRIASPRVGELTWLVDAFAGERGRGMDWRHKRPGRVGLVDAGVDQPGFDRELRIAFGQRRHREAAIWAARRVLARTRFILTWRLAPPVCSRKYSSRNGVIALP